MQTSVLLSGEHETLALGQRLAKLLCPGDMLFLQGDLGAGKTTLARGILRGLGYTQSIKSPTYTIVEPYQENGVLLYHFDLYRINDPFELMDIGLTDYLSADAILLVEWPQKASVLLPEPTLVCELALSSDTTRHVVFKAHNSRGVSILSALFSV